MIVCVCCFSMSTRETGEMTLLFLRMAHTTHTRACQSGTILLFVFVVLACLPERQEGRPYYSYEWLAHTTHARACQSGTI